MLSSLSLSLYLVLLFLSVLMYYWVFVFFNDNLKVGLCGIVSDFCVADHVQIWQSVVLRHQFKGENGIGMFTFK